MRQGRSFRMKTHGKLSSSRKRGVSWSVLKNKWWRSVDIRPSNCPGGRFLVKSERTLIVLVEMCRVARILCGRHSRSALRIPLQDCGRRVGYRKVRKSGETGLRLTFDRVSWDFFQVRISLRWVGVSVVGVVRPRPRVLSKERRGSIIVSKPFPTAAPPVQCGGYPEVSFRRPRGVAKTSAGSPGGARTV